MTRALMIGLAALAAGTGCGGEEAAVPPGAGRSVSVGIQGDVVIEPPRIRIGQTARFEVTVVTPPEHRVAPVAAPDEVPGLWILEADSVPVVREASRWIHRTSFRVRARTTGELRWPAQVVRVEPPDGEAIALALPERRFEVVDVAREWPDRLEPFGLRRRVAPGSLRGALVPAVAGAVAALTGVGLVALVRRARREEAEPRRGRGDGAGDDRDVWRAAHATLANAEAEIDQDPARAADRASAALRLYLTERFAAGADTATTEELTERAAPWGLVRSWPEVIALLRRLDGVRFRPRESGESAADEVRAALRDARAWIGASPPRVLRR